MKAFPKEFADWLTPRGRRILDGRERDVVGALLDPARPFVSLQGVIDPRRAAACRDALDAAMRETMVPMEDPIPADSISGQTMNYMELLPKTVRVSTALLEGRRSRSWRAAESVGLTDMLRSDTFAGFAAAVTGRALRRKWGIQALCYGPGDYSGPHNDHHPEEPEARDGYVDMHVSLTLPGVDHQYLIYAQDGHFTQMTPVSTVGGITVYRLPFWHYTTPLLARKGKEETSRRWVLLGTFLDAAPGARPATTILPAQPPAKRLPAR
ncbi:hypothetical protein MXAN_2381 [Myxococcus xanthus DK 1622]|uniref:Fe2OG dioxygenase domain-containing protein n=1 Tax=Myxococcus xanthus (strain DK1622) TaxID=246197 RepID=Q1D9S2_MYXXD|nr:MULTISPECIES: hypothetical protein [Myxococcus]ABF92278.1 hypothetical protein MXAN_2381 [Myxococcus xanthus DK 1622]NOJ57258.1 hypothetical protein [Myxococcus xanthus]QPM81903.1 hypothetical protein I5Q59_11805 [Myxococcus xanthus]QVW71152.1 hypothetical protein JTM82_17160 [Myxococcus xanthus DZ2]QZZ50109.1 hypothetical protein MyxoNM_12945 [Myxococcus xanthus]